MKHGGKLPALLILSCSLCWTLAPVVVMAKVQVLPEASLVVEGKTVTGQRRVLDHPVVIGLLAAFERAESALKKEDIDTLMQFYAPSYDYHGLKESDVRRVLIHAKGASSVERE